MADERQVFVYKGVEYNLPASFTPEQAKARILQHLGEAPAQPEQPKQTPKQPRETTASLWESLKAGAGQAANAVDLTASTLFAFPQSNENVRQIMDAYERRAATRNKELGLPEGVNQDIFGKIVGGLAGLPAAGFSAPQTTKTFLEKGEKKSKEIDFMKGMMGDIIRGLIKGKQDGTSS